MGGAAHSSKIGLLGGSFNPAHEGHREISLAALSWLDLDAVWWLVSPGNPLKDAADYAPYRERLVGARTAAGHHRIVVSNFEDRNNLQYTIDTLEALNDRNPHTRFVWLMGADSFAGFHRWKDWRRIATLVPLAIFNRPGYEDEALANAAASALGLFRIDESAAGGLAGLEPPAWVYISQTNNAKSSTEIRNNATSKDNPSRD